MNVCYALAERISPAERWRGRFETIGPECFAAIADDGATVICFKGENYVRGEPTEGETSITWKGETYIKQCPTLRVRLHNWLIRVGAGKGCDHDA